MNISSAEVRWNKRLIKLLADKPKDLWIFTTGNSINIMKLVDCERAITSNGGVDSRQCIASIKTDCDGGDW